MTGQPMAVHSVSERLISIAPMAAATPVWHARGAAALSEESTRRKSLAREGWQRERTADALGIHRRTLFTKMKKHGLSIEGA